MTLKLISAATAETLVEHLAAAEKHLQAAADLYPQAFRMEPPAPHGYTQSVLIRDALKCTNRAHYAMQRRSRPQ